MPPARWEPGSRDGSGSPRRLSALPAGGSRTGRIRWDGSPSCLRPPDVRQCCIRSRRPPQGRIGQTGSEPAPQPYTTLARPAAEWPAGREAFFFPGGRLFLRFSYGRCMWRRPGQEGPGGLFPEGTRKDCPILTAPAVSPYRWSSRWPKRPTPAAGRRAGAARSAQSGG